MARTLARRMTSPPTSLSDAGQGVQTHHRLFDNLNLRRPKCKEEALCLSALAHGLGRKALRRERELVHNHVDRVV